MTHAFQALDWAVLGVYFAFVVIVGWVLRRRAGRNVEEFFLSGRTLPWWLAGTSMVATSFAADTPLIVSGWVRQEGIWKNWIWWCYALSGALATFLFARWWRRGEVMTKAEVAELRYQGPPARVLRAALGATHAFVTNTMVLAWVMLAASKILGTLFAMDKTTAVAAAAAAALTYSLMAGFRGVVITDLVQFAISVLGALVLAVVSWRAAGGLEGVRAAIAESGGNSENVMALLPPPPDAAFFSTDFWTAPIFGLVIYLGISWWAVENVDGSGAVVQRIAACRNERQGLLAVLWFNVAHYALRPWPWILVGLASLAVLPPMETVAPHDGEVVEISERRIHILPKNSLRSTSVAWKTGSEADDWQPRLQVAVGDRVREGDRLAGDDPEAAYVVMMRRYLSVGWLGLVAVSLLAAFMSTIDTHVNLASSFFVNDLYRRFLVRQAGSARHYVLVARLSGAAVLLLSAFIAHYATSVAAIFTFFLAFLGGVGPVYLLRWFWWRITAGVEIVAMVASGATTIAVSVISLPWPDGPWSAGEHLTPEGRLLVVVGVTTIFALVATFVLRSPDPSALVDFYRRVRPFGWWGPVRELCRMQPERREVLYSLVAVLGVPALIYGLLFAVGAYLLGHPGRAPAYLLLAGVGAFLSYLYLRRHERLGDDEPTTK